MTVLVHPGRPGGVSGPDPRLVRLLVLAATAMVATHWLRLLPLGVAAPGATRYEDFVDLLTPYVVVGPLLAALARTGADRRTWAGALAGAAVFVQGHGIHLAANSIRHARGPGAPVDLWDEHVGHWLWFVGLALLVAATAPALGQALGLAGVRPGPGARALAVLVGFTWAANVVEGGVVPLGTALAVGLAALGRRPQTGATGPLLVLAFGVSLAAVAAWGLWWGGFPQPSELGWLSSPLSR